MRIIIQRVSQASVSVDNNIVGTINQGLLVLLGIAPADVAEDIQLMVEKMINLRIFSDNQGRMNKSLLDIQGDLLIISQFTLYANVRKGRRPSFLDAAKPDMAKSFYDDFCRYCHQKDIRVETGVFGADMAVSLCNDGPVTITLDSEDFKQ